MNGLYELHFHGNRQEIEKEKLRKRELMSYFPKTLGTVDETRYVLQDDDKPKQTDYFESKPVSPLTPPAPSKNEPMPGIGGIGGLQSEKPKKDDNAQTMAQGLANWGNNGNAIGFGNGKDVATSLSPQNEKNETKAPESPFDFDPWKREKTIDSINKINYLKLNGEIGSVPISRPAYHDDEFRYMNKAKFDSVIGDSFRFEGGFVNNKYDRGGKTNYGITEIFMEQYKNALPDGKVKPIEELTKEDACNLYFAMWNNKRLGEVRDKNLAFVLNDYMINSNEWEVAKRVQRILNLNGENLKPDGVFGTKTLDAIHRADKEWLIEQIIIDRYNNYRKIVANDNSQINNYAGWINRLNQVAEIVGSKLRFDKKY